MSSIPVKGQMKGLLKGLRYISQMFDEEENQEIQIGFPTDVKHLAHIGCEDAKANAPSWMTEFKETAQPNSAKMPEDNSGNISDTNSTKGEKKKSQTRRSRQRSSESQSSANNSPTREGSTEGGSTKPSRRHHSSESSRRHHRHSTEEEDKPPPGTKQSHRRKSKTTTSSEDKDKESSNRRSSRTRRSSKAESLTDISFTDIGPGPGSGPGPSSQ